METNLEQQKKGQLHLRRRGNTQLSISWKSSKKKSGKLSEFKTGENELLIKKFRETGDKKFLNRLASLNEALVVKVGCRYFAAIPDRYHKDLIQEGWIGFMSAVRKYNSSFGAKFSTYAARWIMSKMQRFIEFKIPLVKTATTTQSRTLMSKYFVLRNELLSQDPTMSDHDLKVEIAKMMGCRESDVDRVQSMRRAVVSLDTAQNKYFENGETKLDFLTGKFEDPSEALFVKNEIEELIEIYNKVLSKKSDRDRRAMTMRLFEGQTLEEVGKVVNLTRERVRQIEKDTLDKIRRAMGQ